MAAIYARGNVDATVLCSFRIAWFPGAGVYSIAPMSFVRPGSLSDWHSCPSACSYTGDKHVNGQVSPWFACVSRAIFNWQTKADEECSFKEVTLSTRWQWRVKTPWRAWEMIEIAGVTQENILSDCLRDWLIGWLLIWRGQSSTDYGFKFCRDAVFIQFVCHSSDWIFRLILPQ